MHLVSIADEPKNVERRINDAVSRRRPQKKCTREEKKDEIN
jgi:hypothetical protein